MGSKSSYKIKLSPGMRPYVGRVVKNGKAQQAFKQRYGIPVGNCVRSGVRRGMSQAEIRRVVRDCAKGRAAG